MKQLIVLVATIILGIGIATLIFQFQTPADEFSAAINAQLDDILEEHFDAAE